MSAITSTPAASRLLGRDVLSVGSVGLRSRKTRAALSALGIAIGIASMVAVLGISASSQADLLRTIDRLGTNLLTVQSGQGLFGSTPELPVSSTARLRLLPGVQQVTVTYEISGATAQRNPLADQRGRDGRVLGGPVPESQRVLGPVAVDAQANDAAAPFELDPVEHHDREPQVTERPAHQVDEVFARARHELAADRRLRRRASDLVDICADRLTGPRVAARGHASQHPLEHHVGELITRGEVRVDAELDLTVDGSRPRAADPGRDAHPS